MSYRLEVPGAWRRLATLSVCLAMLGGCGKSPAELLASARAYLKQDDLNAASIQLKNALQEDGRLAEARFLLGSVNLRQGNHAGAEKELRRAAELGFPDAQVRPLLARAMVQLGEYDRVLKEFDGKRVGEPAADAQILAAIGDAHLGRREFDPARVAFDAALAENPAEPAAVLGRARSRLIAGDLDGAMSDADAVVANPAAEAALAEAHALRADVWLARRQPEKAVSELDAAIRARPAEIRFHFAAISILLYDGKMDAATERLAAMEKVAAKHPLTRYLQAMVEHRKGNLTAARTHIQETVRLLPDYLPGRLLAGTIHAGLKEHVLAQEHLGAVVGRAPGHAGARRALAQTQLDSGAPQEALETLQPLLDGPDPDVATLRVAGRIHVALGKTEEAAEAFEKVVAASPDDARSRTQLAISKVLEGDWTQGIDELEAASEMTSSEGEADIALILINLRRGKLDEALAAQQELERKRPDDPRTFSLKGGILLAKRDPAGARAAFEKALALKADHLPAAIALSRLDLAEDRRDVALQRFESVIAANPANVDAYLMLGGLIVSTDGTPDAARAVLERAVKANPRAAASRLALVSHELRFGDAKRAVALAQEVVAAFPSDPRAHGALGRAHTAAGEHPQAVAAFAKRASLVPRAATPLVDLAEAQRLNRDVVAAEQSLHKALALKRDLLEAQQRLVNLLVAAQRSGEAVTVARTVQKQRPKLAVGWLLEGDIHVTAKAWGPAQQAFRKAFELQKLPQVVIKLHAAQKLGDKDADAARTASEWLRGRPNDLQVRTYLAGAAMAEGRMEEAERLYREMDRIKPDNPLVINNLAWLAGKRGDPGAMALAQRAFGLAPQNPAVLDTLGVLQVSGGQVEQGLENLRKAVNIAPGNPAMRTNLARAYAQVGRKDEARRELDALLQQLPEGAPQRAAILEMRGKL